MKWNNRLKSVLTKPEKSGFSEDCLETPLTKAAKTQINLVSSAFVSDEFRHFPENQTISDETKKQQNLVSSAFVSSQLRESFKNYEQLKKQPIVKKSGMCLEQELTKPDKTPSEKVSSVLPASGFYDVFTLDNESGQRVIDCLFAISKKCEKANQEGLLLSMPTVAAYTAETALVEAIEQTERGNLSGTALKIVVQTYIDTHTNYSDAREQWTQNVPLFYLTLRLNGERLEEVTCNIIQSWIIREFWLRTHPESQIDVMEL